MAKNDSQIDPTPATLRMMCSRQVGGITTRRVAQAQARMPAAVGSPRNRMICPRLASSEANFTNMAMIANISEAKSIQRACMEGGRR